MRKYRLFIIKKENFEIYKRNPHILFETLKILSYQKDNFQLGYSLYKQLCSPFSQTLLCNYISEKVPCIKLHKNTYQLLSFYEKTIIQISYSRVVVNTDQEFSRILKLFHIYNRYIFGVDFENNIYFWLNEYISKHFSSKNI